MNNAEINSKDKEGDTYWIWPDRVPTERHLKMMMGRTAEIGVRTLLVNFIFSFGGKNYLRSRGGPLAQE